MSDAIQELLRVFGNPTSTPLRVAFWPWVQRAEKVDNAYFGEQMRLCGEIRATVPVEIRDPAAAVTDRGVPEFVTRRVVTSHASCGRVYAEKNEWP